jgi:uncharacterized protein YcbK (DUF882 family)
MYHLSRMGGGRLTAFTLSVAMIILAAIMTAPRGAGADGDERTISLYEIHTGRKITITYKRDGRFIPEAMKKLNWFLRDWRRNTPTKMDPRLIDLVWELHEESGSKAPIHVVSGYRHPKTNAALRRRGGGQAKRSQHMRGRAMDIHFPDVPMSLVRKIAFVKEIGGVGYYPTSAIPFVHVDTARVRAWPRMSRSQLAMLFPYGRTKHRPARGGPLTARDRKRARIRLAALARKKAARTPNLLAYASMPARAGKAKGRQIVLALLTGRGADVKLPAPGMPASAPAKMNGMGEMGGMAATTRIASNKTLPNRASGRLWFERAPENARPLPDLAPLPREIIRTASSQTAGDMNNQRNIADKSAVSMKLASLGRGAIMAPARARKRKSAIAGESSFFRRSRPASKLWIDGAAERRSWLTSFMRDRNENPAPHKPAAKAGEGGKNGGLLRKAPPVSDIGRIDGRKSEDARQKPEARNEAGESGADDAPSYAERVAYAPPYDDDHPDELSYRPFQILPLMSGKPVASNMDLVAMQEPKYDRVFELIASSENVGLQFRPSRMEAEKLWNSQFRGDAIINIRQRADLAPAPDKASGRRFASLQ